MESNDDLLVVECGGDKHDRTVHQNCTTSQLRVFSQANNPLCRCHTSCYAAYLTVFFSVYSLGVKRFNLLVAREGTINVIHRLLSGCSSKRFLSLRSTSLICTILP